MSIRLCMVEDDNTLRERLCLLINSAPDFSVCGSYISAEACLDDMDWTQVDVLLADIELPGISGVELIAEACLLNPELRAMAFTIYDDRETVFKALRAGALGYLLKSSRFDRLLEAIRQLMDGGSPMSPAIADKVIREFRVISHDDKGEPLSTRETQLLTYLAEGYSYKEIASQCGISSATVHAHISNIYKKLHARNRRQAVRLGRIRGYLRDD